MITEGCHSPAGLLHPLSAAHSFCDPRSYSPICSEAINFILWITVVVIGDTLGPCCSQAHCRLCHALDEVLGCFAVSHCLSGTTVESWCLSQGREDTPMPIPTCLRYSEGRISSAYHWHQLLLLSLPGRPHISLAYTSWHCSAALLHPALEMPLYTPPSIHPSCSCLMPLVFLVNYSGAGFAMPAGKRLLTIRHGEILISK